MTSIHPKAVRASHNNRGRTAQGLLRTGAPGVDSLKVYVKEKEERLAVEEAVSGLSQHADLSYYHLPLIVLLP